MAVQPLGTRLSDALPLDWIAHETLPLPPPTSSSSSSLLMLLGNCIANGIKETVDWLCRSAGDPLDVPPPPPLLRVQSSADTNERPTKIISFTLFGCLAAWLISWMDAVGYYWTCWWWWKRFRPSEDGTTHARRRRRARRRRWLIYVSCVYGFTRRHSILDDLEPKVTSRWLPRVHDKEGVERFIVSVCSQL